MANKLRFDKHDHHMRMIAEFYESNKYILTEEMKDALIDAKECMKYVIESDDKTVNNIDDCNIDVLSFISELTSDFVKEELKKQSDGDDALKIIKIFEKHGIPMLEVFQIISEIKEVF